MAILTFGFAYTPADLLSRVYAHHRKWRNKFTRVLGFPSGTALEIYTAGLLQKLSKFRLPGLPTSPGPAAEFILKAAKVASAPLPFRIRARPPFDAGASYGVVPGDLPEQIFIARPRDIEVARRVHGAGRLDAHPLRGLRLWREASVATRAESLGRLLASPRQRGRVLSPPPWRVLFVSKPSAFSGHEQNLVQTVSKFDATSFRPFFLAGLVLNGEVFGESPAYDLVRDFIWRRRLGSWVRIVPFVEDIRELHAVADVLLLCSEREGLGQCVIEAMAMGVPVIVTCSGALPEIVRHGETGFVVPPGDAEALAAQMIEALASLRSLEGMIRAARDEVEQKFDAAGTTRRVMGLYYLPTGWTMGGFCGNRNA